MLSFFKKGDTIKGGTLFKGGHYLRKYGMLKKPTWSATETTLIYRVSHIITPPYLFAGNQSNHQNFEKSLLSYKF